MLSYRCDDTSTSFPRRIISVCVFLALLFRFTLCYSSDILIGTGERGSFSHFAAKAICQAVERYDSELTCSPLVGQTATDNLTNLQNDSIDIALVSSKSIYDAFHQAGAFRYITMDYNNLRLLMPMYRSPVSLVVRKDSGISCLDDLQGKRVNCGNYNTLENQIFKQLMTTKSWKDSSFSMVQALPSSMSQDSLALKTGSIQAMFHVGMHPSEAIGQLLSREQNLLVPLNDDEVEALISEKVGFSRCTIGAGTYPSITEDLKTLAMETLLVGSSATDDQLIETVLSALHKAREQLQHAHASLLRQHTTVSVLNDSYLHPHPAALIFFQATRSLY